MRVLVCTILALLTAPVLADAKPGYVVFSGDHEVELSLKGSHGYSIEVAKTSRFVEMFVNRDPDNAAYLIRRRQTNDDGVEVEFPGVGRVSVEFHPVGPPHREAGFFPSCRGGETTKQPGYFQGTIRIRGERGYTSAHTGRASGDVTTVTIGNLQALGFQPLQIDAPRRRDPPVRHFRAKSRPIGRAFCQHGELRIHRRNLLRRLFF